MTDQEQTAQRLQLYIHQLCFSARQTMSGEDRETTVSQSADVLREELKRMESNGEDPALALMMIFMMEGVRV